MKRHRIKRVPVVSGDGKLVGILSRADVMKIFARADDAISVDVAEILHRYRFDHQVNATTVDGRVTISGEVEHRSGAELIDITTATYSFLIFVPVWIRVWTPSSLNARNQISVTCQGRIFRSDPAVAPPVSDAIDDRSWIRGSDQPH